MSKNISHRRLYIDIGALLFWTIITAGMFLIAGHIIAKAVMLFSWILVLFSDYYDLKNIPKKDEAQRDKFCTKLSKSSCLTFLIAVMLWIL